MKSYIYQNNLIGKKQLRQLLAWTFTNYDAMQACSLADELKYLGFKYAAQSGISVSIEDLRVPFAKGWILEKANKEVEITEKLYVKGRITEVERFQKIIDTWSLSSERLKNQIVQYFKSYDPLNSVYIMAFSGARGNLSQVRQLVGMRGLMSDPSGQVMNLAITSNFREGLTITDYLISGYGARKGIVDTSLKTANSGYLTRRLVDVAQDILIREKDCGTNYSFLFSAPKADLTCNQALGRILNKPIIELKTNTVIANKNTQITPILIKKLKEKNITELYIRSPLTCNLYRSVCQKCYGWDLATENLVDIGEAIGILAGQSIGEPGTQLTMRTFHTGGVFKAEAPERILSPVDGILQYHNNLQTALLRTNRGEEVLVTRSYGSVILIPESKTEKIIQVSLLPNTVLFPKNNQYLSKGDLIGEVTSKNKQVVSDIKPIISYNSGETFIPSVKQKLNILNQNKLVWILAGQLYLSPMNSFVNFYPDFKINQDSFIYRTKIMNHYSGSVKFINSTKSLSQKLIKIRNKKDSLINSELQKIRSSNNIDDYILTFNTFKYRVNINEHQSKYYINLTRSEKFGTLITSSFQTLTGGTLYYNYNNLSKTHNCINYVPFDSGLVIEGERITRANYNTVICYKTIIWLGEETHNVNCEEKILLVENGDFISKDFELIPGLFSKTSGLVTITSDNNVIKRISIKPGLVYQGKNFETVAQNVYYPGEIILENIHVKSISFCEHLIGENGNQLLVRPIEIYELPHSPNSILNSKNTSLFTLNSKLVYSYKPNQSVKGIENVTLASSILTFKTNKLLTDNISIELSNSQKTNSVNFNIIEKLRLNHHILPNLRYKDIQSSFLIQENQFLSSYTTLGYLEAIAKFPVEIVKFKTKQRLNKEIFLISNHDCFKLTKEKIAGKKLNDFIISESNIGQNGKIIWENGNSVLVQRGKLYFFPQCKNEDTVESTNNVEYKFMASDFIDPNFSTDRNIAVSYHNILKFSFKNERLFSQSLPLLVKFEFSKFFLKKNGRLYRSLVPQLFKKFSIRSDSSDLEIDKLLSPNNTKQSRYTSKDLNRTVLLKNSELVSNQNKESNSSQSPYQLTLVKFLEQPFSKSTKSVGLYSITEDYFEKDLNSIFCKTNEFIEAGKIIGFLNFEKEITGDIVQGLPRIEEILEARKKNTMLKKRIPTSKKKGVLTQKTSLDINFEFKKLGSSIFNNSRINPHKLLQVYFNYYGVRKFFSSDTTKSFKAARLTSNHEGSYKSFKKVQSFILNSVQSVYQSQGANINDKHLEVIIKQMTTKVLITFEGDSPLSRREVIDLYHIQYINKILTIENKESAYYVPLLLGITKAALNNPSFISAASFQETTSVLTKAAIEGRMDWLRGLKENIIIGHLIPAGTGSPNYRKSFKNISRKKHKSRILNKTI